jgi:hypothetical protein
MKELLFTIFRIQVFFPKQIGLFSEADSPPRIIVDALLERPTLSHPKGSWHIGNLADLGSDGLYFAIGKELPRSVGMLDDQGDFVNQNTMLAPNTHVVLDLKFQVLAIARNSELSPAPKSVARKLQNLLQDTKIVRDTGCSISIDLITDPAEFVDTLLTVDAVTKFQVSYSLPNVWDAEDDFQRPFQETSRELRSETGTATFKGRDLERSKLVQLTRAAAAVGKRAKAWVRRKKTARSVPVTSTENPATYAAEAPEQPDVSQDARWAHNILLSVREVYEEIRSREE